jgi:hypothetical protein
MDDRELNALLREWKAPDAPPHLQPPTARVSFWAWLLTGSIRIPVPVGVAVAALVAFWLFASRPSEPPVTEVPSPEPVVSLADFTPVEQVEVRIVGELK